MIYRYHLSHQRLSRQRSRWREKQAVHRTTAALIRKKDANRWTRGLRTPRWAIRIAKGCAASMVVAGVLALAGRGGWAFLHSKTFEVREVRTSGLEHTNATKVLERLRPPSGVNLFDLDLSLLKGSLLAEPWIKEVSLRKEYPNALSIQVIERHPVAVLADQRTTAIVDETGAVMDSFPSEGSNAGDLAAAWSSLPMIHGIETLSLQNRDPQALRGLSAALEILHDAPFTVYGGLNLNVGHPDDVRVQRRRFAALPREARGLGASENLARPHSHGPPDRIEGSSLLFGAGPFDEKWRRFLSVESEIKQRHPIVREIDLRFPQQVIVR